MHEPDPQPIRQILIKPTADVILDEQQQLTRDYVARLQALLTVAVELSYVRPMNAGVHVLGLTPALDREVAITVSEVLSARDDVEYAEPDFLRRRR